jgi:hypothetical protein
MEKTQEAKEVVAGPASAALQTATETASSSLLSGRKSAWIRNLVR